MAPDEPFFGWQLLRAELSEAARKISMSIYGDIEDPPYNVRVYGELYGGSYPHPDVLVAPGASAVQTGIWYCPDVKFTAFDIVVDDNFFLADDEMRATCTRHGLQVSPLLRRGTRAELERMQVCFQSRVPDLLGLPPIAGNWAEGMVLKPDERASINDRYVIKRKIPEFDDAKFDDSAAWDQNAQLSAQAIGDLAARLVNPARWASARSKAGENRQQIFDEVVLDVLIDLEAAFPAAMVAHDGEKIVRERVTRYMEKL